MNSGQLALSQQNASSMLRMMRHRGPEQQKQRVQQGGARARALNTRKEKGTPRPTLSWQTTMRPCRGDMRADRSPSQPPASPPSALHRKTETRYQHCTHPRHVAHATMGTAVSAQVSHLNQTPGRFHCGSCTDAA